MEYHPVTLEILRDYKNSPETDVSLEILTLIIDSKIFLDINFIHKYILTYKKNIKNKKTAIKKLEHKINTYFERKVYKNIDDHIVCIEKINAFASFVLPKNTCAILQLKNDSDISSLGLANRILRLIFVNRENAKRRLLSQLENDSKVLCPNIPVNNEQRDGTGGIDKDVDKKRRNKNVTENIRGLQRETKRDEGLTTEDECFTKQKCLEVDATAKKPKKTRRTSKSTKKCIETASSVKKEDENNLTQDIEGIADKDVKRIKRPSVHSISNYIKREKIVEIKNKDDRKFLPINFPPNTLIFQIGHTIKSVRKYQVGKKLTYVKFHDTIRPSFHTICTKYKTSNSVKRIPFVLNYDEDSDLLWNDDESGESINYATDSEEDMVEEDSFECSWIEEGEEYNTKKVDLSFRMIQPNMKICFLKDQKKYKFCD